MFPVTLYGSLFRSNYKKIERNKKIQRVVRCKRTNFLRIVPEDRFSQDWLLILFHWEYLLTINSARIRTMCPPEQWHTEVWSLDLQQQRPLRCPAWGRGETIYSGNRCGSVTLSPGMPPCFQCITVWNTGRKWPCWLERPYIHAVFLVM